MADAPPPRQLRLNWPSSETNSTVSTSSNSYQGHGLVYPKKEFDSQYLTIKSDYSDYTEEEKVDCSENVGQTQTDAPDGRLQLQTTSNA